MLCFQKRYYYSNSQPLPSHKNLHLVKKGGGFFMAVHSITTTISLSKTAIKNAETQLEGIFYVPKSGEIANKNS